MAKEFYLKFSAARYWMTATHTGKHAQKEFETRSEVKEWLIERGVLLTVCGRLLGQSRRRESHSSPFEKAL
jgi:hypothetical protein